MKLVLLSLFLASAASDKPATPIKCGVNEYAVPCKTLCPPQSCDAAYTDYRCDPISKCIPGCDCIKNYLRDSNNKCIFKDSCDLTPTISKQKPQSNESQTPNTTPRSTPLSTPQTKSASSSGASSSNSSSSSSTSTQSSASSHSCNNDTEGGGSAGACTYNICTPTCSIPSPRNCPQDSNPCKCPKGSIISERGGKCVQREECPRYANCKGDYNATYTDCPIACPSTCAKPNAEYCNTECGNVGCSCNFGYILSKTKGKCIKLEDCPGGKVCGPNESFVYCAARCPDDYCPQDDSRAIIACDPPYPCPSGCTCKGNYLRKSEKEKICIPASDCPPVKCTRPNEEWNSCPPPCFSDNCSERNKVTKPGDCQNFGLYCRPQCVCKKGFYRNENEICVPARECR